MTNKKLECLYRPLRIMNLFENQNGLTLRQIEKLTKVNFSNLRNTLKPFVDKGYFRIGAFNRGDCQIQMKSYAHKLYYLTEEGEQLRDEISTLIAMFENIVCNIYTETPKCLNSKGDTNIEEVKENDTTN